MCNIEQQEEKMATRAPRRQKQAQKKLPMVVIHPQKDMPSHYSALKTIADRAPKVVDISNVVMVKMSFTLRELFETPTTLLTNKIRQLVDEEELRALVPPGADSIDVAGYVTDLRCLGYFTTSPTVLYAGMPELTRTSWSLLKVLSPGCELPPNIESKLSSNEPLLTVTCVPCTELGSDSPIGRALQLARTEHGVHLLSTQKDGESMTQNPKMTEAIRECIGVTIKSLEHTYIKNTAQRTIYTPGDSLLAAVVKSFPENVQYLVWNDKSGATEFDHTTPVMLCVPEKVANFAIKLIHQRKENIKRARGVFANVEFSVQAAPSHGRWHYDAEESVYVNEDTGKKYNADQPFDLTCKFEVNIRYVNMSADSCALSALSSQFYPMSVWRLSDFTDDGVPKSDDVKPYPGSLTESVREKWKENVSKAKRMQEDISESEENTGAASSSPVSDD